MFISCRRSGNKIWYTKQYSQSHINYSAQLFTHTFEGFSYIVIQVNYARVFQKDVPKYQSYNPL